MLYTLLLIFGTIIAIILIVLGIIVIRMQAKSDDNTAENFESSAPNGKKTREIRNYLQDRLDYLKTEERKTEGYMDALSSMPNTSNIKDKVKIADDKFEEIKREKNRIKAMLRVLG